MRLVFREPAAAVLLTCAALAIPAPHINAQQAFAQVADRDGLEIDIAKAVQVITLGIAG